MYFNHSFCVGFLVFYQFVSIFCVLFVLFCVKFLPHIYRVSQEECASLREGVPYAKLYRYNPKHLSPKWNGYGDNGQRKVWSSCGTTHCTCQLTILSISNLECGVIRREFRPLYPLNCTAHAVQVTAAL